MRYEDILERMILRVEQTAAERNERIDTREGSLVRTALAPIAFELAETYIHMAAVLDEAFADTASRSFLIRRAAERGIHPILASRAVILANFNVPVPMGARFSIGQQTYAVIELRGNSALLECETPGAIGNVSSGRLAPVGFVPGLTSSVIAGIEVYGEDDEPTEIFRARYFSILDNPVVVGNVAHYYHAVLGMPGVGGVKIFPAWQGGGTVLVVLLDAAYNPPDNSGQLVKDVQNALDPDNAPWEGEGLGIAPIGHKVTVRGARVRNITVRLLGVLWSGNTPKIPWATDMVRQYFMECTKTWDKSDWRSGIQLNSAAVVSMLFDKVNITQITSVEFNGVANLTLEWDEIPILNGSVTT